MRSRVKALQHQRPLMNNTRMLKSYFLSLSTNLAPLHYFPIELRVRKLGGEVIQRHIN